SGAGQSWKICFNALNSRASISCWISGCSSCPNMPHSFPKGRDERNERSKCGAGVPRMLLLDGQDLLDQLVQALQHRAWIFKNASGNAGIIIDLLRDFFRQTRVSAANLLQLNNDRVSWVDFEIVLLLRLWRLFFHRLQ